MHLLPGPGPAAGYAMNSSDYDYGGIWGSPASAFLFLHITAFRTAAARTADADFTKFVVRSSSGMVVAGNT
jgi:hypothetical protein